MNKNLIAFFSEHGIEFDKTTFYGELNGYQVSGNCVGTNIGIAVNVHLNEGENVKVADWLKGNKRTFALSSFSVDENGFYCVINTFNASKKCIEYLESAISFVSSFKQPHCCSFCGNELGAERRLVGIGFNKMYAHEHCFDEYCDRVRNNEVQTASAPNNYLKGTLGALVGALVGGILWVIMYSFVGVISFLGSIVGSLLAAFLWDKLGGKNDKIKLIVIWVGTIVIISLAMFISYLIDVQAAMNEYNISGNAFEWFKILLEDEEYKNAIIMDTLLSYVFLICGNVYATYSILKSQTSVSNQLTKY